MKKFTFLMAMVFAMVMNVSARTIYLDANIWAVDNPKFSAWAWAGEAEGAAYEFTLVEGTVFQAEIPDAATGIIFLRNDPAKFDITKPWDAEWNRAQTTIPADMNMFRVSSWDEPWGTWMNYGTTVEFETHHLYVNNQTGWDVFDIYAYGNSEAFGGWPGATTAPTEVMNGVTYNVYEFQVEKGGLVNLNLIIHNNVGEGVEGDQRLYFTISEARDYYLEVTATAVTEQGAPDKTYSNYHLYVNNQTGWVAFHLYAWGDSEVFGTWPGMVATETIVKDGVTYLVYPFTAAKGSTVATYHLIFHNNIGEGVEGDMRQLFDITEARDYYVTVNADGVIEDRKTPVETIIAPQSEAKKVIRTGQLMIVRDGRVFNILGAEL